MADNDERPPRDLTYVCSNCTRDCVSCVGTCKCDGKCKVTCRSFMFGFVPAILLLAWVFVGVGAFRGIEQPKWSAQCTAALATDASNTAPLITQLTSNSNVTAIT